MFKVQTLQILHQGMPHKLLATLIVEIGHAFSLFHFDNKRFEWLGKYGANVG